VELLAGPRRLEGRAPIVRSFILIPTAPRYPNDRLAREK